MTQRDARTERLVANRRAAAAEKQTSVLAALDKMMVDGDRVSFVSVERAAGASTWFVYNNPTVRYAIEVAMREQKDRAVVEHVKPTDDRTAAGLRAELGQRAQRDPRPAHRTRPAKTASATEPG